MIEGAAVKYCGPFFMDEVMIESPPSGAWFATAQARLLLWRRQATGQQGRMVRFGLPEGPSSRFVWELPNHMGRDGYEQKEINTTGSA